MQIVALCLVRMLQRNNVSRMWPNEYNIMQHPKMLGDDGRKIWPFSNWRTKPEPSSGKPVTDAKRESLKLRVLYLTSILY